MRLINVTQLRENGDGIEVEIPTVVNADYLRCFYPRRADQVGTRLTFADGGGFAVSETFEQISALLGTAAPTRRSRARPQPVPVETTGEDDGLPNAN